MGQRNATFVDCDRCGEVSQHNSPAEANKYTMMISVSGMQIAYAPRHESGQFSWLCPQCAHAFRDWWREPNSSQSERSDKDIG